MVLDDLSPEEIKEQLENYTDKVDSPERLALFQSIGQENYADATLLNLMRRGTIAAMNAQSGNLVQDNAPRSISFLFPATDFEGNIPSAAYVAARMNNLSVNITETQTPVLVWILVSGTSPIKKHLYLFTKGKGNYGSGGTTISASWITFLLTQNATPEDVEQTGNTHTIDLEIAPSGDYLSTANAAERNLSQANTSYFFKYTTDGSTFKLLYFIGAPGLYGGSNSAMLTAADFQEAASDDTPPVIITAELPKDLFVSCTSPDDMWANGRGGDFTYRSDTYRTIDIRAFIPSGLILQGTAGVDVQSNDIYIKTVTKRNIAGAIDGEKRGLLKLGDCRIVNNILVPGTTQYKDFTEVAVDTNGQQYNVHGMFYSKGSMFFITRQTVNGNYNNTNTQILKVNCSDISQVKVITTDVSVEGFNGYASDIMVYENYAYFIIGTYRGAPNRNFLCRVDENLNGLEMVFEVPNTGADRFLNGNPFEIYAGEIYFATIYNFSSPLDTQYNTIGMKVYDIAKRTLARSVNLVPITSGSVGQPRPHWLTVYNGKIILHTGGSNSANPERLLVRFDAKTLAFEESISLGVFNFTNVFSIDAEGWVYANPESPGASFKRYKYNKFTENQILQLPPAFSNYYSAGSPRYYAPKEKFRGDLADFSNSMNIGTPQWGGITGTLANQADVKAAIDAKLNSAGGTISGDIIPSTNNALKFGSQDFLIGQAWLNRIQTQLIYPVGSNNPIDIRAWNGSVLGRIFTSGRFTWGGSSESTYLFDVQGTARVSGALTVNGVQYLGQYTNATEPAYVKGTMYFNTTINKLRIGGATGWETVTSS